MGHGPKPPIGGYAGVRQCFEPGSGRAVGELLTDCNASQNMTRTVHVGRVTGVELFDGWRTPKGSLPVLSFRWSWSGCGGIQPSTARREPHIRFSARYKGEDNSQQVQRRIASSSG